jgi:ubiquinone/menaquinone biosynthesis C-methylase UbiE
MNRFTRWVEEGKVVLWAVGVRGGLTVLDFGCGLGNYSIPAAKIVGEKGKVYALDKDRWKLNQLMERADSLGLKNIEKIETAGDVQIPLADASVDVVLLYDVLHHYYFTSTERRELLQEVYRISKSNAIISVYPKHREPHELTKAMEEAHLYLKRKHSVTLLVHDDNLEEGEIYNFTKG